MDETHRQSWVVRSTATKRLGTPVLNDKLRIQKHVKSKRPIYMRKDVSSGR